MCRKKVLVNFRVIFFDLLVYQITIQWTEHSFFSLCVNVLAQFVDIITVFVRINVQTRLVYTKSEMLVFIRFEKI